MNLPPQEQKENVLLLIAFSSIGSLLLCISLGFSLSLLSNLCKVLSNEKNPQGIYVSI